MGERKNNDILTTLAFLTIGVWAVSAVFKLQNGFISARNTMQTKQNRGRIHSTM